MCLAKVLGPQRLGPFFSTYLLTSNSLPLSTNWCESSSQLTFDYLWYEEAHQLHYNVGATWATSRGHSLIVAIWFVFRKLLLIKYKKDNTIIICKNVKIHTDFISYLST